MQKYTLHALAATVLLAGTIAYLTLTKVDLPPLPEGSDKVQHALAFFGLSLPVAVVRPRWLWLFIPAFIGFGWMIEVIQPYVGRDRDVMDLVADGTGVALAALVGWGLTYLRRNATQAKA